MQAISKAFRRISLPGGDFGMMPLFSRYDHKSLDRPFPPPHPAFAADRIVAMNVRRINLHLVSEATGETLNALARATTAQFENTVIVMHRWSLIRTSFQLHRVLDGIEHEPGPVLSTLVDHALRGELEQMCMRLNLPVVNV